MLCSCLDDDDDDDDSTVTKQNDISAITPTTRATGKLRINLCAIDYGRKGESASRAGLKIVTVSFSKLAASSGCYLA